MHLLMSAVCINAWYLFFLCAMELHCCPSMSHTAAVGDRFFHCHEHTRDSLYHQISSDSGNSCRLLEAWCYFSVQRSIPPVLIGTTVIKEASSTEDVAQRPVDLNTVALLLFLFCAKKQVWTNSLWDYCTLFFDDFSFASLIVAFSIFSIQPVGYDIPTDGIRVRTTGQGTAAISSSETIDSNTPKWRIPC